MSSSRSSAVRPALLPSRGARLNVVPGVKITALMPPMCTAGYGLARESWSISADLLPVLHQCGLHRVFDVAHRAVLRRATSDRSWSWAAARLLIGTAVFATCCPGPISRGTSCARSSSAGGRKLLTEAVADPRILVLANTVDARARTLTLTLAGPPLDSIVEGELQSHLADMARGKAQLTFRYKSAGQIDLSTLKQELRQDLAAGLPNDAQQRRLQDAQMALAGFTNAQQRRREVLRELQAEFPEATEITVAEGEQRLATDSVPQPTLVVGMRLTRRTAAPTPNVSRRGCRRVFRASGCPCSFQTRAERCCELAFRRWPSSQFTGEVCTCRGISRRRRCSDSRDPGPAAASQSSQAPLPRQTAGWPWPLQQMPCAPTRHPAGPAAGSATPTPAASCCRPARSRAESATRPGACADSATGCPHDLTNRGILGPQRVVEEPADGTAIESHHHARIAVGEAVGALLRVRNVSRPANGQPIRGHVRMEATRCLPPSLATHGSSPARSSSSAVEASARRGVARPKAAPSPASRVRKERRSRAGAWSGDGVVIC